MPTFIMFVNWTDQAVRNIKNAPNRSEGVRRAIEKFGGKQKSVYVTMGQFDLIHIIEAPDSDAIAKIALTAAQTGNVRTTTVRAFSEDEIMSIIDDLD